MKIIRNIAKDICYYMLSAIYYVLMLATAIVHLGNNIVDIALTAICTPFEKLAFLIGDKAIDHCD